MNLSTRDQIAVSLAVMLLLSLLATFGGYMAGRQAQENAAILASDGVGVVGKITDKVERFGGVVNGPKYTWWLDVSYTTLAGETRTRTIGVDHAAYDRASIGPAPVTYIRSNPGLFYIDGVYDGANHSSSDIAVTNGISFYGAIASAAFGLALAGLLIARRAGDAPAAGGPVTPRPGPQPLAPSGRQAGQFGARRRRQ
ncbi:MAG: hypothetical protein ABSG83_16760 [Roseiarcus sp.]|jgi:hypothetical protein